MEQGPSIIDWKGLLLIGGLVLVTFLPLDLAIEWAADRWSLGMLHARYRQTDAGTLLAFVLSILIASGLSTALGIRPLTKSAKLDSKPPLP